MIKEALQYLIELGNIKREKVGSQEFSTQPLHLIEEPTSDELRVQSLSGLVEYINSDFDGLLKTDVARLIVHVLNPTTVECLTQFTRDKQRNYLIKAIANLPDFEFDNFYDSETFNIKLQSAFVSAKDRAVVLQLIGNIREEQVKNSGDDGVAQTVTAKVGVATVATAEVPNPVVLKPYRTFTEVDQPASDFVLRLKDGPKCALFEADGGAWELEAMRNIKNYLVGAINSELLKGQIVIIA
ncbi:MAG: hypothetical protein K8E24_013730 [Methanobacterium paludis]|nr:hypothetical protein [Methanobacterium paludis]